MDMRNVRFVVNTVWQSCHGREVNASVESDETFRAIEVKVDQKQNNLREIKKV